MRRAGVSCWCVVVAWRDLEELNRFANKLTKSEKCSENYSILSKHTRNLAYRMLGTCAKYNNIHTQLKSRVFH